MKWPRVLVSLGLEMFQNAHIILVTHIKIKYKKRGEDLGKGKEGRREREMEGGEERGEKGWEGEESGGDGERKGWRERGEGGREGEKNVNSLGIAQLGPTYDL